MSSCLLYTSTKRIHERPVLTPDQSAALEVIGAAQRRASGEVVVLDGVTGSGKTCLLYTSEIGMLLSSLMAAFRLAH